MSQAKVTNFFSTAKRGRRGVNKKNVEVDVSPGLVESTNKTIQSKQQQKISNPGTKLQESLKLETSKSTNEPLYKENEEQAQEVSEGRTKRKLSQDDNATNPAKKIKPTKSEAITPETLTTAISQAHQLTKKTTPTKAKNPETLTTAISQAKGLTKKLTPAQIKEKLTKVGKLADLKNCLSTINAASVKNKSNKKITKQPAAAVADVSPKDATTPTPAAYERFHALSQPASDTLPLPYSYKFLLEVFRCTDTVVAMMHNRQERITIDKIRKAVQEMMRKDFCDSKLRQIHHVFPAAYTYAWEKIIGKYGAAKNEFELQVAANTGYKDDIIRDMNEVKTKGFAKMLPNMLVERKRIFSNSLLQIVRQHHNDFLSGLNPPIQIEAEKIHKWHRDFDVDACAPVLEKPFPPKPVVEKLVTAREILDKAEQLFNLNPKLSEALVAVSEKADDVVKEEAKIVVTPPAKPQPALAKGLKGLNAKLIEKIRAKEAAKAKRELTVDPLAARRLDRYRRLPGLARIIRNIFITEMKAALDVKFVAKKAAETMSGFLNQKDIEEDIGELIKIAAPWPTLHAIRDVNYLKIKNDIDINVVVEKLEGLKAKLEAGKLP